MNDWVDANCFFTVGKSMFNGQVPYRDLFEQKGPLLYFLHGMAWLISHDSFLGVYFIEIAAAFLFLLYSYKIIRLYHNEHSILFIPLLALFVYTSDAFCHGDSAEELCLPLLTYALWVAVKSHRQRAPISSKEYFIIGTTAGCVLWIKFTMLGFYIGWFILPAYEFIRHAQWKHLLHSIGLIICGIILATIPWIIYFSLNHAVGDWLTVYLYDNLFYYPTTSNAAGIIPKIFNICKNIIIGFNAFLTPSPWAFAACLISFFIAPVYGRKYHIHLISMIFSTFIVTYIGGRTYPYYALVMSIFMAPGFVCLLQVLPSWLSPSRSHIPGPISAAICICLAFFLTPNRYLISVDKSELPQYKFQQIISQDADPTLLNYGFLDGGFYTVCDVFPNCKSFCSLNIPIDELWETQQYYADNGLCDYIVTRDNETGFERYDLISEADYYFEGATRTYRLYRLR